MWIGIECGCEVWELERGAAACDALGVPSSVGELLRRAGELVGGGAGMARNGGERLLEIERRAAEAVERVRVESVARAGRMIGRLMGGAGGGVGCDAAEVGRLLSAAGVGCDGWRGGRASGGKNGGVAKRRRGGRLGVSGGSGVIGADGGIVSLAGKEAAGVVIKKKTLSQWEMYGRSFEGWCAVELKKMGFKMTHVARGLGTDVGEAWRCISGWERYWKVMGSGGVAFGGPEDGWEERLEAAVGRATGSGIRGRRVRLNGGCGAEAMGEAAVTGPKGAAEVADFVRAEREKAT